MKNALMIAMLLFSGCVLEKPSGSLPDDLEILYSYGACHAEWGQTNIFIDAQGNGVYEKGSGPLENGRFQKEEFRKTFRLSADERLALLNEIEKSGFFSLKDHYFNPDVMDGSCSAIFVTKNNVTKSVSVSNSPRPEPYSKAADAIALAAESKTK